MWEIRELKWISYDVTYQNEMRQKWTSQSAKFLIKVIYRGLTFQVVEPNSIQEIKSKWRPYPLVTERIQPKLQKLIFLLLMLASTMSDPHLVDSVGISHCKRNRLGWFGEWSRRWHIDVYTILPLLLFLMLGLSNHHRIIPDRTRNPTMA
jgi:hypothetical protein